MGLIGRGGGYNFAAFGHLHIRAMKMKTVGRLVAPAAGRGIEMIYERLGLHRQFPCMLTRQTYKPHINNV